MPESRIGGFTWIKAYLRLCLKLGLGGLQGFRFVTVGKSPTSFVTGGKYPTGLSMPESLNRGFTQIKACHRRKVVH